jgi:Protein of unknown function (DUF664)
MAKRLPKPPQRLDDTKALFLAYLDQYRSIIVDKLDGMSDAELRTSRLPSGWTPIELLKHLIFMERRWLRWGFAAQQVVAPWGDNRNGLPDEAWYVGADETADELIAALRKGGDQTRAIVESADLTAISAAGGRFVGGGQRPTLNWILFHVFQEYARHAGHLDVARELSDGRVGE